MRHSCWMMLQRHSLTHSLQWFRSVHDEPLDSVPVALIEHTSRDDCPFIPICWQRRSVASFDQSATSNGRRHSSATEERERETEREHWARYRLCCLCLCFMLARVTFCFCFCLCLWLWVCLCSRGVWFLFCPENLLAASSRHFPVGIIRILFRNREEPAELTNRIKISWEN